MPATFMQALAVDISLAALLGKGVYNFGELLLHPIVSPLPRSSPLPSRPARLDCLACHVQATIPASCACAAVRT